MFATDFEYDGQYLGNYGFIICDFNHSSGADVISTGSKITFRKVPYSGGTKHGLVSAKYDECLQTTFDICKSPDHFQDMEISNDEFRAITRWLNRKKFLKFQLFNNIYENNECYFYASFNTEKILVSGKLVGIRLFMETNTPFGFGQEYVTRMKFTSNNQTEVVMNISDEIGYMYPNLKIHCLEDGDLVLRNGTERCSMVIKNCIKGEVVDILGDLKIIRTSIENHDIANDFNYEFFMLGNSPEKMDNYITSSIKCDIVLSYSPIVKDAF